MALRLALASVALGAALAGGAAGAPDAVAKKRHLCAGKRATIVGSPAPDGIRGTPRADVIVALGGSDRVDGRGGDDLVCGGPGGDLLMGGAGHDRLEGGPGSDVLLGGSTHEGEGVPPPDGDDRLGGGDGADMLLGGTGRNVAAGGRGSDACANAVDAGRRAQSTAATPTGCEGPPARAPRLSPIEAVFNQPVTQYSIAAANFVPSNSPAWYLAYRRAFEPCGLVGDGHLPLDVTQGVFVFTWSHPHPPCPQEEVHPATISFQVHGLPFRYRGLAWTFTISASAVYPYGSAPGRGASPTLHVSVRRS